MATAMIHTKLEGLDTEMTRSEYRAGQAKGLGSTNRMT